MTEVLSQEELELVKKCAKIKELKLKMETLKTELSAIEDSIKVQMKDKDLDQVVAGCFKISYKDVSKESFDSKKFKEEHTDLYEQYVKKSTYKRFEIR